MQINIKRGTRQYIREIVPPLLSQPFEIEIIAITNIEEIQEALDFLNQIKETKEIKLTTL